MILLQNPTDQQLQGGNGLHLSKRRGPVHTLKTLMFEPCTAASTGAAEPQGTINNHFYHKMSNFITVKCHDPSRG